MNSLVLIGMPAAGKSTVGVILAKVLGKQFVDSDLVIQQKDGRLLSQIIAQEGVEGFIKIENDINSDLTADNSIIATGGSVVYGKEAMERLKSLGTVVYIKLSYETLSKRLHNIRQRGVVLKEGQDLKMLYEERCPLYEKYADITVEAESADIEELVSRIVNLYQNRELVM